MESGGELSEVVKHSCQTLCSKKSVDHGNSHLQMDGYMTAWFRYYLTDDAEAGKAFWGADAEIKQNSDYKYVAASK